MENLETLILRNIGLKGLDNWYLHQILYLDISNNQINSDAKKKLLFALNNSKIERLILKNNPILFDQSFIADLFMSCDHIRYFNNHQIDIHHWRDHFKSTLSKLNNWNNSILSLTNSGFYFLFFLSFFNYLFCCFII